MTWKSIRKWTASRFMAVYFTEKTLVLNLLDFALFSMKMQDKTGSYTAVSIFGNSSNPKSKMSVIWNLKEREGKTLHNLVDKNDNS